MNIMEGVQIEQLAGGGSATTTATLLQNGDALVGGGAEGVEEAASAMNGQLEIEIPVGERQGAIHTIQLQSPGGNTHIVEGLVVTTGGGVGGACGEEGETTTLFHPTSAGATFLMPATSNHHHHHHHNHLQNSGPTIVSTTSGSTCEVITADTSDHHILSGLQVVRVTTGENGETIFLVPSSATGSDKHGDMQQVMVLQSADEIGDDGGGQEMMEDATVELNIPSPKPVLTTVKQESSNSDDLLHQQFRQQQPSTTHLVVVTGGGSGTGNVTTSTVPPPPSVDQKPILASVNGHNTGTPPAKSSPAAAGIGSSMDNRPKRKAALKALATRRGSSGVGGAAGGTLSTTPRRQSTPKGNKKGTKVEVTLLEQRQQGGQRQNQQPPSLSIISTTSHAPPQIQLHSSQPSSSQRIILAGSGAPPSSSRSSFGILPEEVVSDSEDEGRTPRRKCVVCLRSRRFTEDIFDESASGAAAGGGNKHLLQHMDILISHLNIPARGKPNEVGICPTCLDSLQRWHIFNCAIVKRHEVAKTSPAAFENSPLLLEPFETRVYRNFKKMSKVKEVYMGAAHKHMARRYLTERDWDYFCEQLFRFNSVKSERARELERYLMCREKLTHIFCVKCSTLIKNGKKGFAKHVKMQHPHEPLLFPCDICGEHFPDKEILGNSETFYAHWIAHFYFNPCDDCGKRFPTKRGLGQHRHSVHKNKVAQWNTKSHLGTGAGGSSASNLGGGGEDRPWKCDHCDASFKMKGALVSHRDVVHFNLKNHVCATCGEAFKSASSLRGHVRRHEGRRDYKCEVCHKEYYTYSALKGHKVVHQTARDFVCGICGKAFKKKKALEEHGTLHTGVKPHRCPICGREIRVKSNLYKHMKIHKKNAELGITTARGRHTTPNNNSSSTSNTPAASTTTTPSTSHPSSTNSKVKEQPLISVKHIKVEETPLVQVKEETTGIIHRLGSSSDSSVLASSVSNSSSLQGATAVDVVLENSLGAGDHQNHHHHRGPIVVSIMTDGLSGSSGNILDMDPEQQAQILSAVTSLANSQGQTVTVQQGSSLTHHHPTTTTTATAFLASPQQVRLSSNSSTSTVAASAQDPLLEVSTGPFYNTSTSQFLTTLDQLQN